MNNELKKLFKKQDKLMVFLNKIGEMVGFYDEELEDDNADQDYYPARYQLAAQFGYLEHKLTKIENQIDDDEKGEG